MDEEKKMILYNIKKINLNYKITYKYDEKI